MQAGLLFIRDLAVVLLVAAAVGGLFRKLGLSIVVGYLVAGMLIGPYTPPFTLVSDIERINTLSQLGLVFLMFFVGMELSLGRLRRLGLPVMVGVAITAWLVFNFSRFLAAALGWEPTVGLFLAAMLMVSSSAILSKTLGEAGMNHEKFGRRAIGMSLMEDVVAVAMLTLLTTKVGGQAEAPGGLLRVLGLLGGFVALLVCLGVLIVPRFLRRLARASDSDLKVAAVAGVLMWVAYLAASAGYSVALGAFLLGMIVGETAFRERIERAFTGVQGMFVVIFFVSIGMLIDVRLLLQHWPLILGIAVFSIVVRTLCATCALLLTGNTLTGAVRTGLIVTPIGEFSYIIAQLGVSKHAVPDYFYGLAVGVSAVTAFTAPLLLRASEDVARWVEARQPRRLARAIETYRAWLDAVSGQLQGNSFWRLTRGRIGQVLVEGLLLFGVLGFSPMLRQALDSLPGVRAAVPALNLAYWAVVFTVALAMAVALFRNLSAMGMIFADAVAARPLRPAIEGGIQFVAAIGLIAIFWALFPLPVSGWWSGVVILVAIALFLLLFWRRLVRWHSQFQFSVSTALDTEPTRGALHPGKSVREEEWGVDLVEVVVPEDAPYAGRSLRDLALRGAFGVSVVAIDRQGFEIPNPGPDRALYPGDKILLLGGDEEAARARAFLEQHTTAKGPQPTFGESSLETVIVPPESARVGRSLAELEVFAATGVQVLGIRRSAGTLLNPAAAERLLPHDRLLIVATPQEYTRFRAWLAG
jgi:CPA2 family monovalent cation:H+ antiporter-2